MATLHSIHLSLIEFLLKSGRIRSVLSSESMPSFVRNMSEHPAGPMTIFFWAPTSKWLLSVNNLLDLKKGLAWIFFYIPSFLRM